MTELNFHVKELIKAIQSSEEYTQYQNLCKELKQDTELWNEINRYRIQNFYYQMNGEENALEESRRLQMEFQPLMENSKAELFLRTEQEYCRWIREIRDDILEGADVDISFLI